MVLAHKSGYRTDRLWVSEALPVCPQGFSPRVDGPRVTKPVESSPVGPLSFSPWMQLLWQRRDNVFFTPIDPVSDDVYVAQTALVLRLPFHQSFVEVMDKIGIRYAVNQNETPMSNAHAKSFLEGEVERMSVALAPSTDRVIPPTSVLHEGRRFQLSVATFE